METLVVNLFAGPGTGKSTTAAGIFCELKNRGICAELALEYAKDKVWEDSLRTLENQIYVFGKQHHRIWRLLGKVPVIITDSPLLLSLYYGNEESNTFHHLVLEQHRKLWCFNVFLLREKEYEQAGRLQTEAQAKVIDNLLRQMLHLNDVPYDECPANRWAPSMLADEIETILQKRKV